MPRIPMALLRKAHAIDPLLPTLLAPCRDLQAARSELRWLREHVERVAKARWARGDILAKGSYLRQLVKERGSGRPLQYILGMEYFGDLEIQCRPGVLIPRQDTAASITHLVRLLRDAPKLPPELRIMDLCTGTGCIPLLFRHELYSARNDVELRVLAVDISDEALELANHNMQRVDKSQSHIKKGQMDLLKADVLVNPFADQVEGSLPLKPTMTFAGCPAFWDILISNPPYISPTNYWKTTTRSVRGYEPKLALVPPHFSSQDDNQQGDMFYPRLLDIARDVEAKIVLLEVADIDQARRVAQHAREFDIFDGIEIWREDPASSTGDDSEDVDFPTVGQGNARNVLCWRGSGSIWLNKTDVSAGEDGAQRLLRSAMGRPPSHEPAQPETASLEPGFDLSLFEPVQSEVEADALQEDFVFRPLRLHLYSHQWQDVSSKASPVSTRHPELDDK